MKLIADSGSTKTAWAGVDAEGITLQFETKGINPVRDSVDVVATVIEEARRQLGDSQPVELHFYGAGCIPPYKDVVTQALQVSFPFAEVHVESDLLGAARALCGHDEGIACILGTGSNSCYYDGTRICENVSPLGWILGDEGSGAVLGRRLVGDVLKRQFPQHLCDDFEQRFQLTRPQIIEAVYRALQPNRFLASLVPFLAEHVGEPAIHDFLVAEFRRFFVRNVKAYGRPSLLVHFVGGIAAQFQKELTEAAEDEELIVGRIERSPIIKMVQFHS